MGTRKREREMMRRPTMMRMMRVGARFLMMMRDADGM